MAMVFPVPIIRPEQYDAFRREIGRDLADTYDEWAKLFADTRDDRIRRGETLIEVEVDYDAFIRFCSATGTKPNLKTLLDFAIKKSRS